MHRAISHGIVAGSADRGRVGRCLNLEASRNWACRSRWDELDRICPRELGVDRSGDLCRDTHVSDQKIAEEVCNVSGYCRRLFRQRYDAALDLDFILGRTRSRIATKAGDIILA